MKDERVLKSENFEVVAERESDTSLMIKINGVPAILLEEELIDNKPKIILKVYPNKYLHRDDDYINLERLGVDMEKVEAAGHLIDTFNSRLDKK